jgi:phosphoribosylanthranilate isomerase
VFGAFLEVCGFKFYNEVVSALIDNVLYFGFIFVPTSKRFFGSGEEAYLELRKCCQLMNMATLPGQFEPTPIAVFQYDGEHGTVFSSIRQLLAAVPEIKMLQLYGFPLAEQSKLDKLVGEFSDLKLIFCISVTDALLPGGGLWTSIASLPSVWGLCIDKPSGGSLGGNGISWEKSHYEAVHALANPMGKALFIAGGVSIENAKDIKLWVGEPDAFQLIVLDASSAAEPLVTDDEPWSRNVGSQSTDAFRFFDNLSSSAATLAQQRPYKDMYRVRQLARAVNSDLPSYFGGFGGQFVPQTILMAVNELSQEYDRCCADSMFWQEIWKHYTEIAGRPVPLYKADQLSEHLRQGLPADRGATIWLKVNRNRTMLIISSPGLITERRPAAHWCP